MDDIDHKITGLLAEDSRRSLAEIGGLVGLSPSAVNERIRRLAERGAIRRFTLDADPVQAGRGTLAFVLLALHPDANEPAFRAFAASHPDIAECHHVTGGWSYFLKLNVASVAAIESFLDDLKSRRFMGRSETVIALSSPVPGPFIPRRLPE